MRELSQEEIAELKIASVNPGWKVLKVLVYDMVVEAARAHISVNGVAPDPNATSYRTGVIAGLSELHRVMDAAENWKGEKEDEA